MDAPYLYVVQFWIKPDAEARLVAWLREKHLQEVADQPGFLWARMVKLDQTAQDGWQGYVNLYGLESKAALDAYFASSARALHERVLGVRGLDARGAPVGQRRARRGRFATVSDAALPNSELI